MNILIIGQGIAGSCLSWELRERGVSFHVVDRPIGETASRVAAGLVNPMTGRAMRAGWRQRECLEKAKNFYPITEQFLQGSWWQVTPIYRELETEDQLEIWTDRQQDPDTSDYAGPLFPWPDHWDGRGQAAYVRGSAVLHVEYFVNAWREFLTKESLFTEASVEPCDIQPMPDGSFLWNGQSFSHIVWANGWEAGLHPEMQPLKGRPSKGTIIDVQLPDLSWEAGILHFGHWLVHHGDYWRFGATYAWAWEDPGVAEMSAIQELILSLSTRYHGEMILKRSRAAVRPIIRRSQPVAGPIPNLDNQYVFSGLGSKGVTTAPWTAAMLASHLVDGAEIPPDLLPAALWK